MRSCANAFSFAPPIIAIAPSVADQNLRLEHNLRLENVRKVRNVGLLAETEEPHDIDLRLDHASSWR
jgi:hypothetical protein